MSWRHRRKARRLGGLVVLLCLLSGCGGGQAGYPVRQPVDTGGLTVGNYPVTQRVIGRAGSERSGRVREGQRLSEYVLHGFEVDPRFVHPNWATLKPHVILDRTALSDWVVNDTFDEVARDLVTGYGTGSATAQDQGKAIVIINAVLLFPDVQSASRAAGELARDDFSYEKESVPAGIPGHPQARAHLGRHKQNRAAGVSAWTVHGRFVLITLVRDFLAPMGQPPTAEAATLVGKVLDAQLPLLGTFVPTPAGGLSQLPLDRDGMLGHALPVDQDKPFRADEDMVLGPRGMLNEFDDPAIARTGLTAAGVDLAAFADGAIFRARDEQAAQALFAEWMRTENDPAGTDFTRRKPVPSPPGMTSTASCTGPDKSDGSRSGIYLCAVRHGRYLAQVVSNHIQDVHQRAAAQYVLLGDW